MKRMRTRRTANKLKVLGRGAARLVPGLSTALAVGETLGGLRGTGRDGERKPRRGKSMFLRGGRLFLGFTSKEVKRALRSKRATRVVTTTGRKVA